MSSSHYGFVKNKLCEISLMFFGNRITNDVKRDEMAGIMLTSVSHTTIQAKEIWSG